MSFTLGLTIYLSLFIFRSIYLRRQLTYKKVSLEFGYLFSWFLKYTRFRLQIFTWDPWIVYISRHISHILYSLLTHIIYSLPHIYIMPCLGQVFAFGHVLVLDTDIRSLLDTYPLCVSMTYT